MPYRDCIDSNCDGCTQIDSVRDDTEFADIVAQALRNHPAAPPRRRPSLSNTLQGNLCEFCVWDIGERFWHLYKKKFTWPANASNPWDRRQSNPGIDILALTSVVGDEPIVFVIEVKSSSHGGSGAIVGDGGSLQADFKRLMSGVDDVQTKLQIRAGALVSDLILQNERPDLAEKVNKAVGSSPDNCHGVKLIGVMVCKRGNTYSQSTRLTHFQELQAWLLSQGWKDEQIECHSIEIGDFSEWLGEVIERAIL